MPRKEAGMDDLSDTYTAILRELAERRDELVTHCRGEGYSGLDIHISRLSLTDKACDEQ